MPRERVALARICSIIKSQWKNSLFIQMGIVQTKERHSAVKFMLESNAITSGMVLCQWEHKWSGTLVHDSRLPIHLLLCLHNAALTHFFGARGGRYFLLTERDPFGAIFGQRPEFNFHGWLSPSSRGRWSFVPSNSCLCIGSRFIYSNRLYN